MELFEIGHAHYVGHWGGGGICPLLPPKNTCTMTITMIINRPFPIHSTYPTTYDITYFASLEDPY